MYSQFAIKEFPFILNAKSCFQQQILFKLIFCILPLDLGKQRGALIYMFIYIYKNIILYFYS